MAISGWCLVVGENKNCRMKKAVFPSDLQYDSAAAFEHLELCRK